MDSRYWGPSAWQLFHLIAFRSPHPEELLLMIKDVLPCKFCRESTTIYTHESPPKGNPGKWLYNLHNKVNHKLRTQSETDKDVIDPGPNPSFEDVKKKYMEMMPTRVPGRDFLFSIAVNYPDNPDPNQMSVQRRFLKVLAEVYPFPELRSVFQEYYEQHMPALESRKSYMKWMYGLLVALSKKVDVPIPTYKGYVQQTMYYKSGCSKKTYRGKTCRRMAGGGRTKDRDHVKTRRHAHAYLLSF